MEYQVEDRRGFQRFIGLSDARHAADHSSFWLFREALKEHKLTERLFDEFSRQLARAGLIAHKGQLLDASFVKAPVQSNTPDENARIKASEAPDGWKENKRRQKYRDARWTKKGVKSFYGYKNRVNVDNAHELVWKYAVTNASVHDSQKLDDLLDGANTSRDIWSDSAFHSAEIEACLKTKGYRSHIHRKAVRTVGIARVEVRIGLMNLTYNMQRFCTFRRIAAS